jgi:hypothetical protein
MVAALSSFNILVVVCPVLAADVTPQRLLNAPAEQQNWLMVHRDYNNSRHSPLSEVNRTKRDIDPECACCLATERGKGSVFDADPDGQFSTPHNSPRPVGDRIPQVNLRITRNNGRSGRSWPPP